MAVTMCRTVIKLRMILLLRKDAVISQLTAIC